MEKEQAKYTLFQRILPFLIAGGITAGMLGLDYLGYIDIENMFGPTSTLTLTIFKGSPYEIDYANDLIPMLNSEWVEGMTRNGYTFYLESGKGFPPTGMILGTDGVLRGTPAIAGTNRFIICVKDVGGNSKCANAVLNVKEPGENGDDQLGYVCPATSWDTDTPCGTTQPGGARVSAIYVPLTCLCPSDTYDYESNFLISGEEYRTCVCIE